MILRAWSDDPYHRLNKSFEGLKGDEEETNLSERRWERDNNLSEFNNTPSSVNRPSLRWLWPQHCHSHQHICHQNYFLLHHTITNLSLGSQGSWLSNIRFFLKGIWLSNIIRLCVIDCSHDILYWIWLQLINKLARRWIGGAILRLQWGKGVIDPMFWKFLMCLLY